MLGPGGGGGGGEGELVVVHDLEAWRAGSRELSFMSSTEMAAIFVNMEYFTEPSCKGKLLQQLAHVQEQLNM
ncbi:unnamed protein product [Sphagnum jensenii]|uniref:Uncharacterized protein n=2 Tax=Sphagnum jensenii TaxID=128206 RepID=A0ABP1A8T3_9BRYO